MIRSYPKYSKYLVYSLVSENKIFYIGSSTNGLKRPYQHFQEYTHKMNKGELYSFIKKQMENKIEIFIDILEECCSKEEVLKKEIAWISEKKMKGAILLNISNGYRQKHTHQTILKIKESQKKYTIEVVRNDGKKYESLTEAAKDIDSNPGAIYNNIIGKTLTVKGFNFESLNNEKLILKKKINRENAEKSKKAQKRGIFDSNGNYYESISSAARALNLTVSLICRSINRKNRTTGGYSFYTK